MVILPMFWGWILYRKSFDNMQKIGTLIFSDKSKADNFLRTIRIHVLKVNIVNTINDKYEFKVH